MIRNIICQIEKYALHDGPGIRSVVFLKGCPLRCLWCANPETQRIENELYYNVNSCIQCGSCVRACANNALYSQDNGIGIYREQCTLCGKCMTVCPGGAICFAGTEMSVDEVFTEINKDRVFYQQSGGGITISGGEVLMHEDFATALLKMCRENYIHSAIETSGFGHQGVLQSIAQYCDVVLFDIKHTDNNINKRLTGVECNRILQNLVFLSKIHTNIIIRVPLLADINDNDENIRNIVDIAVKNGIKEIHLLPYHSLGKEKYRRLGRTYNFEFAKRPGDERINQLKEMITQAGLRISIGG